MTYIEARIRGLNTAPVTLAAEEAVAGPPPKRPVFG